MKIFLIVALILVVVLAYVGYRASRFGYESAGYSVVEKDGAFEIRNYADLTLASTSMKSSNPGRDGSFMRLFRYISKGNENGDKIAMTTPVFMTDGSDGEMSFVVPAEVAKTGAPAPTSGEVTIKKMKGGRVAAYRYSGSWDESLRRDAKKKLEDWVNRKELKKAGDFFSAGYDPPFTPGFMKRNEVLIRLED